ncbi:FAD-dependent oxidoreductase [Chloroflexota bacterium]
MNTLIKLFEPGKIGRLSVKNRIVMAPMGVAKYVGQDGMITEEGIDYFATRAKSEVGLIITGSHTTLADLEFAESTKAGINIIPRFDIPEAIPRYRELAKAVHNYGAKIAIQLTAGFGRVMLPQILNAGATSVAPSALANVWDPSIMTRELTTGEVERLAKSFGDAAEMAVSAGFDAIELHGHEGYIMDQFMTSLWNKRNDKYGGNLDSRLRFILEIIENIKSRAGKEFPIIFLYALDHYIEAGRHIDESLEIARRLEQSGVDALHVDAGCYDSWYWPHPPVYLPPGCMVDLAEAVKKVVRIPVITVGRLGYPELAEDILWEKKADFIALGRPLLADPEWALKAKEGRLEDICPCIGCHVGCLGVKGYQSCAVNPACFYEKELSIKPAEKPRTVLVVGGGIAGMEAARVASLRGHQVTLYEKSNLLGGHLISASVPEFKRDLVLLKDYYATQIAKLGVKIVLGKEVTSKLAEETKPEVVIIATGSTPIVPEIPGIEKDIVVTAIELLLGKKRAGERVIVAGGGLVGCETAVYLAQHGKRVTIVEMLEEILAGVAEPNKQYLFKLLAENGVNVLTETSLSRITDEGAIVVDKRHMYEAKLKTDTLVLAVGLKSERELVKALEGKVPELHAVGDCEQARKIDDAVEEAFRVMRVI